MRHAVYATLFSLFLLTATGPAFASDPAGTWINQEGDTKVRISRCGDGSASPLHGRAS